jgi:hypothetical protein
MESGVIFGLSAALYGEITIDHGAVVQPYFSDYEMVRFAACREIEVHIHESDAPLGGAGEPGILPVAPAPTNATFADRHSHPGIARHEPRAPKDRTQRLTHGRNEHVGGKPERD